MNQQKMYTINTCYNRETLKKNNFNKIDPVKYKLRDGYVILLVKISL